VGILTSTWDFLAKSLENSRKTEWKHYEPSFAHCAVHVGDMMVLRPHMSWNVIFICHTRDRVMHQNTQDGGGYNFHTAL